MKVRYALIVFVRYVDICLLIIIEILIYNWLFDIIININMKIAGPARAGTTVTHVSEENLTTIYIDM